PLIYQRQKEGRDMPLPEFNSSGDLPPGVHRATLEELVQRFGAGTPQRQAVTASCRRIYHPARATGKLLRFLLVGSYLTFKPEPADVDVVLIMRDDQPVQGYDEETRSLFDHQQAEARFGASVFWTCPSGLLLVGDVEAFLADWGIKRDRTR